MKTVSLNLYEYSELSDEAKKKALNDWNKDGSNLDPQMQSHMINLLKEELDERKIEYDTDSIDVYYSLSYCQGDGFMFEGSIQWKGLKARVKHSGHYYHSYSKNVEWYNADGEEIESVHASSFEAMYQEVCKKMERAGYDQIEYEQSAEVFEQVCDENEYTFEADGTLRSVVEAANDLKAYD